MTENEISYIIRGVIFKVYQNLGPGLLESVYETALVYELIQLGLNVQSQFPLPLIYGNAKLSCGFRIDILVENKVIIEIKSVENLGVIHHKQLLTYLRLANIKLGILVNFNCTDISKAIHRKVNNL